MLEADYSNIEIDNGRWRSKANCRAYDPNVFFVEGKGCSSRLLPAKVLCYRCQVQRECLDYAVANGIKDGVWGGLAYRQRLAYRKGQRRGDMTMKDVLTGFSHATNPVIEKIAETLSMEPEEVKVFINSARRKVKRANAKNNRERFAKEESNA